MPRIHNCSECGRPIKQGNERKLNGKYYGSGCIDRQVDRINVLTGQEEFDFHEHVWKPDPWEYGGATCECGASQFIEGAR